MATSLSLAIRKYCYAAYAALALVSVVVVVVVEDVYVALMLSLLLFALLLLIHKTDNKCNNNNHHHQHHHHQHISRPAHRQLLLRRDSRIIIIRHRRAHPTDIKLCWIYVENCLVMLNNNHSNVGSNLHRQTFANLCFHRNMYFWVPLGANLGGAR